MPKQLLKIEQFHGGLNTNSDPRDIAPNELSGATDVMVDELGKIRLMGGSATHGTMDARVNQISPGYGLFQFSHDRVDGHTITAGADDPETGADYMAFSEADNAGTVDIYSAEDDDFESVITGMTSATGGLRKDVFYYVNGALRVSDSNFVNSNEPVWFGYINRHFFGDGTTGYDGDSHSEGVQISQWFKDEASPKALPIKSVMGAVAGSTPDISNPIAVDLDPTGDYQDVSSGSDTIRDGVDSIQVRVIFSASSSNVTCHGSGNTNPGFSRFCSIGDKINITDSANSGENDQIFTVADVPEYGTDPDPNTMDFVETVAAESDDTVYMTNLSRSLWFDPVNTGWQIAVSTLYDDSKQESALDVSSTTLYPNEVGSNDHIIATSTGYKKIRIDAHVFAGDGSSTGLHKVHTRVTGFKIYMRRQNTATWFLQAEIDMTKGNRWFDRGDWEMWADAAELTQCAHADGEYLIAPREVETYESETGYDSSISSVGFNGTTSGFKTAVVANNIAYAGNVKIADWTGKVKTYGDAILKSTVGKFDSFVLERRIETSNEDGDSIIKLEEYADRLLEFKKNKMSLINISQELEFLEDTFMHKGVSHPAAVCKTDYGVAWVNRLGCYLYDGQKVDNLLEKGGRQIIKESDWINFTTDYSMVGYLPKKRQLIVTRDSRSTFTLTGSIDPTGTNTAVPGTGTKFLTELSIGDSILVSSETRIVDSITDDTTATVSVAWGSDLANDTTPECLPTGDVFIYDMVTQSWVKGDSSFTDSKAKTNLVTDWNGDLVWVHTSDTGTAVKWDDASDTSAAMVISTKDIDFGQPGQKKNVYKVIVTYQSGNATTNVQVDYGVDGDTSFAYDFTVPELPAANGWQTAELVPDAPSEAKNIKSIRLRFATDGTVPAAFEINDVSIVYRLKGVR